MRKVCANLDREDGGLDTVLEVPVPELHHHHQEPPSGHHGRRRRQRRSSTVKAWVRSHMDQRHHRRHGPPPPSQSDVQLLLGVIGAPMVPQPVAARKALAGHDIKDEPLEVSKAKYIVEQYVAACGGEAALSAATSMYAVGKVALMRTTNKKGRRQHKAKTGSGEVAGGFVVWQKKMPEEEMWCVEMVVAGGGTKMSAGSDGKVAWRQTPWQPAHASRGPPRPLRRCVQGLDPKSTANLFATATWVGEKRVIDGGEDCFVLRVDADAEALRARSSADVEVVRHAVWGYFSQRTGLLARLEDTHLLRIRTVDAGTTATTAYWETSMESSVGDYRPVDGVNVAHAGRTVVSLSRYGGGGDDDEDGVVVVGGKSRTCTWMEETWSIEEVEFNIRGLSAECFLPPRDMVPAACSSKPVVVEKERCAVGTVPAKKNADAGTCDPAAAIDGKQSKNSSDGGVRPAATTTARKALVPATAGLPSWFGTAKVVAVETVDTAHE